MQTKISPEYNQSLSGQRAEEILRSCVHCGFCTATCPTYQLLGDELDSPRGRIYLIKQLLEGNEVSQKTQQHLDRCLVCRSCETTCPSGVDYSHLLEIGRHLVDQKVRRPLAVRLIRQLLRSLLPYPKRFSAAMALGRLFKPLLPKKLKQTIPDITGNTEWSKRSQKRKMLILNGCVQPSLSPSINAATSRVLGKLGIELINKPLAQCCGAVNQHLDDEDTASVFIKQNIDQWWPLIESAEAEAIVITASGCGAMVKDYGYILRHDAEYADKARVISQHCKDLSEIIATEDLSPLQITARQTISFHSPCTLQHAQKINGVVEGILSRAGFTLNTISDGHLCCGSAGTYSILQPAISQQLKANKIKSLQENKPDLIATANIGCLHHLSSGTQTAVKHWIELLDTN
ncbi:MAG: glycolate oxidase subunit GlcF [Gammaproteobacteria bacterium]|nr:glycolate oxidase subunit GlcF [Gammaproteobacteria bacterium]